MTTFMVEISLSGLTVEQVKALMPEEDRVVRELSAAGVIQALYAHADFSGAYLVGTAESGDALQAHLSRLPMYPHMTLKIVPVVIIE